MSYCRQDLEIHTKATEEEIKSAVKPILEFTNAHGAEFCIGFTDKNECISRFAMYGKTSAYCRGVAAEVKQMLKEAFHCKVDVIYNMY